MELQLVNFQIYRTLNGKGTGNLANFLSTSCVNVHSFLYCGYNVVSLSLSLSLSSPILLIFKLAVNTGTKTSKRIVVISLN